ncbi:hypothetical protein ES703_61647 [subsurface metagenome]
MRGRVRPGVAWLGKARQGKVFLRSCVIEINRCTARRGNAWPGLAGQGWAWHGKVFLRNCMIDINRGDAGHGLA